MLGVAGKLGRHHYCCHRPCGRQNNPTTLCHTVKLQNCKVATARHRQYADPATMMSAPQICLEGYISVPRSEAQQSLSRSLCGGCYMVAQAQETRNRRALLPFSTGTDPRLKRDGICHCLHRLSSLMKTGQFAWHIPRFSLVC